MGGHSVVPDRWHQTCYPNQLTIIRQLATTLRQLLDYYLLLFHAIPTTYNNYNY